MIESLLDVLEKAWDDDRLMLYVANGVLCLVNVKTGEVIQTYSGIHADGGDRGTHKKGYREYLNDWY